MFLIENMKKVNKIDFINNVLGKYNFAPVEQKFLTAVLKEFPIYSIGEISQIYDEHGLEEMLHDLSARTKEQFDSFIKIKNIIKSNNIFVEYDNDNDFFLNKVISDFDERLTKLNGRLKNLKSMTTKVKTFIKKT